MVDFVTENFPQYDWLNDRRIFGGCSRRRPDLFIDLMTFVLIIENDENGDRHSSPCDNRRNMELSQDVGHRPIVFIRFNPDAYTNSAGTRIKSCWITHRTNGMLYVPQTRQEDWQNRLETLRSRVDYYISLVDTPPERTITEEYLFFNAPTENSG